MTLVAVREARLSIDEVYDAVCTDAQGAVVLFVGRVRNNNQGNDVTLLEYEAYTSMAEKEICRIAAEISLGQADTLLACVHRVGRLQVGDVAIICAASSPHRETAFAVCHALIERVKATVPVWKREHGAAGPYWLEFRPGA